MIANPILLSSSSIVVLLFLLYFSPITGGAAKCDANDRSALLIIYGWFGSSNPFPTWNSSTDCCTWGGIHCDHATSRVTGLAILNDPGIGKIPPAIGSLTALRSLRIEQMPNVYGTIAPELASLSQLRYLNISFTGVYGSIPSFIGNLTALRKLDLSHNKLSGAIPNEIVSLSKLRRFDVSSNQLCGRIPTGGPMARFGPSSYAMNKCLCGTPLPPCK